MLYPPFQGPAKPSHPAGLLPLWRPPIFKTSSFLPTLVPYVASGFSIPARTREELDRLLKIGELARRMGVSLAEAGAILARSGPALPAVIEQQIAMLDPQLAQSAALCG